MDFAGIRPRSEAAQRWLREQAWPVWLEHGIDREHGGFHEHLSLDGHACSAGFRRLRVVTRQITVFAAAALEEVPGAREAVRLGCDFLLNRAKQPDGGYAWRFDIAGEPIDQTRDLYDHAFVLLAWSAAAPFFAPVISVDTTLMVPDWATSPAFLPRVSAFAFEQALELDHYLQTHFRDPNGGYLESLEGSLPRRQNPHMHLLEAYLQAAEIWHSELFFSRAEELAELFLDRLFQTREGALPEFFDDSLAPLRDAGRFMVEPGHHAEWIWLLSWFQELAPGFGVQVPDQLEPTVAALARFLNQPACRTRHGALVDEMWSDGTVRAGSARLWPQTERLKSELLVPNPDLDRIREAYQVLDQFIAGAPRGLWHERWTAEQGFSPQPAPASSLYHLTAGILVAQRALRSDGTKK